MDNDFFKKITITIILAVLGVLTFFLLKPILLSIIVGIILAIILMPIYKRLSRKIKYKNLAALIICFILFLAIILPIWFFTPILINQSFKIYFAAKQTDFVTPLQRIFPSLFASDEFSAEIGSVIYSFVTNTANSFVNMFSEIILNFPTLFLQVIVAFFTLFFVLRDKDIIVEYVKSLMPFPKDVEKKLFESSTAITLSVLYGQILTGIIQGLIVGLGFFIFNAPNSLVLTLLACVAGIFPIIGTTIVWLPVLVYLFIGGNIFAALGIGIFGIISTLIDNFVRPAFVSKRTNMHPLLILIGMVGGLFLFGILGFILGPLIIAYILIIVEVYRKKGTVRIFTQST
ncbi:MAG: AI-2E family transporter [Candidatus Pacearchaeota archaeon]|nr:AI-2E family transporter [Candidatus Pacearchaeota archaeon]